MGFFPNGDEVLKGIKRGAAKFGSGGALDAVKGMAKRLNGFSPAESEPYGLGMGGGEGEQSAPTQAEEDMELANAGDCKACLKAPAAEGKHFCDECAKKMTLDDKLRVLKQGPYGPKGNDDAGAASASGGNVSSSSLGYESAQKTTTEQREKDLANAGEDRSALEAIYKKHAPQMTDAEKKDLEARIDAAVKKLGLGKKKENSSDMASKCQACGHESAKEWTGKCEGCGVKNASDASGRSPAMRENAGRLVEEYRGYRLVQDGKGFAAYEKNGPTLVAASSISLDKLKEEVDSYLDSRKNADEAKCGDCGATKGLVELPASRGKEPKYLCRQCWDDNGTGERENDGPRDCTKCGHDVQTDHTATSSGMKCKLCDCRDGTTYKNDGAEQTQDENYPHDAGAGGREAVRVEEEITNSEKRNVGHLGPDAWIQASLEERIQWLESAGCDINLATFESWEDLSEDVHVALQDRYDMPASQNNASAGAAAVKGVEGFELVEPMLNSGPCQCGHEYGDHGPEEDGRLPCSRCKCMSFYRDPMKNASPLSETEWWTDSSDYTPSKKCKECTGGVGHHKPSCSIGSKEAHKYVNTKENTKGDACPSCGSKETFEFEGAHGDNMACSICDRTWDPTRKNAGEDKTGVQKSFDSMDEALAYTKELEAQGKRSKVASQGGKTVVSEIVNGGDGADVQEIERHVEGIEHEVNEMKENVDPIAMKNSGVNRGAAKYGAKEIKNDVSLDTTWARWAEKEWDASGPGEKKLWADKAGVSEATGNWRSLSINDWKKLVKAKYLEAH